MEDFMRQGGFVPKNHNSGVYWVRANAGGSSKSNNKLGVSPMWDIAGIVAGVVCFVFVLVLYA